MAKFMGEIVHGEKYIDKASGQEKWKNTQLGSLWYDEEKDRYSIKFLGQWVNVFPPKAKGEDYSKLKEDIQSQAPKGRTDDFEDSVPF